MGTTAADATGTAETGLRLLQASTPAVRGTRCPYARLGVAFYRSRFVYWQIQRGATIPAWRKPRNCADAKYLAVVWSERSYRSRQLTKMWWEAKAARRQQVIDKLNLGVAGTAMAGTGKSLERWGRRYHVSPFFIVAAAATESSRGDAACNTYNAWGLGNCGTAWSVPSFGSWDAAIAYYARFISSHWPSHSTPYSFTGYAACDACWGRKVSEWMGRLFGVPAVTRYP